MNREKRIMKIKMDHGIISESRVKKNKIKSRVKLNELCVIHVDINQ